MTIEAKFNHLAWDEVPVTVYNDGHTLKQAEVRYRYTGALEGESTLRYQCLYTVTHQPHPEARPRPPAYLSSTLGVLSSAEWRPRCPTLPSRLSSSKTWPS